MAGASEETEVLSKIRDLERIVRSTQDALELCAFLEGYQSSLTKLKNRKDVFDRAVESARHIFPIVFCSFYLIDEKTNDIQPLQSYPPEREEYVEENVDDLIEKGTVALAFRERRTVVFASADRRYDILLHSLYTSSHIKGMFFGFLERNTTDLSSINSVLLTIIMKSTAYTLENFELYRIIDEKNSELESANTQLDSEIRQKEEIENRLRESEIIYRNIFENMGNPTVIVGSSGEILLANSQFADFCGHEKLELESAGVNICDFFGEEEKPVFPCYQDSRFYGEEHDTGSEYIFEDRFGRKRIVLLNIFPLGVYEKHIISFFDISRIKQAEAHLSFQAYHDSLTGLPNRALLEERLEQAIKKHQLQSGYNYSILFVDLDRLKSINDTMGHAAGDEAIVRTGERLKECVRDVDTVARFGGDEFIVLLEGISSRSGCEIVVSRIQEAFKRPVDIKGQELFLTLSIGVLIGSKDYLTAEAVIQHADKGMYQAKKQGMNHYFYYEEELAGRGANSRLYLESQLAKALEKDEIYLTYQPMAELDGGKVFGLEALVRWNHPELGVIPPGDFIPIAEESGLIVPLGKRVFSLAFVQFSEWLRRFSCTADIFLSVNVSARQLLRSDVIKDIREEAERAGMPFSQLQLEITETAFIEKRGNASAVVAALKEMGVQIALDEFGVGYSSLNYLSRFYIDMIKVDKELVRRVMEKEISHSILKSILVLGGSLDLKVIAVGVEEASQLEFLKEEGCCYGQGSYLAEAQNKDEVELILGGGSSFLSTRSRF